MDLAAESGVAAGGGEENAGSSNKVSAVSASSAPDATSYVLEHGHDVIVCESKERTAVVNSIARTLGLPYVPFRIVFVEGTLAFYDQDVIFIPSHVNLLSQLPPHSYF